MRKKLFINNKSNSFKKTISIDGDKSISIRALLLGSQASGKTSIENILLSEDLCKRFAKLNAFYWSKSATNNIGPLEADSLQKKANKISKIINDLKKNNFKAQVLAQCANLFYEKEFEEKLDSNRDLIRFNNGVYDLRNLNRKDDFGRQL